MKERTIFTTTFNSDDYSMEDYKEFLEDNEKTEEE